MDAGKRGGRMDVRRMRAVECAGDRNEDVGRKGEGEWKRRKKKKRR